MYVGLILESTSSSNFVISGRPPSTSLTPNLSNSPHLYVFLSLTFSLSLFLGQLNTHLGVSCRPWQGASRSVGYSWGSGQRWRCRWDTQQTLLLQCNTAAHHGLEENRNRTTNSSDKTHATPLNLQKDKNKEHFVMINDYYQSETLPICLRVSSTDALRLTLDNRPRQKRSELEGSVKPSTVSEGCEAWKVSPTRWFSS